jgi:Protein kinase domain
MPPLTGRVIAGRYNLQTPIGRGAMGVVWRAHDNLLDREVAVKEVVISALIGADERRNAYQRTLREARTAARLSHRGVVAIYDVVEEDGRPWIIMELVPSQSLDQILVVEGRLSPARAGRIGQQVLSALAAAHLAGVLHRDVKPSNVLIASNRTGEGWDERAVLTDFGIAQFEGDPRLTQTGMVMGSPGFTAPERIRGSDATPASDLWSLGATIYAAVEGRGPYENRGGAITTMSAIINEDAPLAPHAGPLAPVIAALLRRDPFARPSASMASRMFAQALPMLSEIKDEPPAVAHPPTIRSAYVPAPAAPAASAPVTAPDSARPEEKQAAEEESAEEAPAAQSPATEEQAEEEREEQAEDAPSAAEAPEAASAVAVAAGEADAADAGEAECEPEAGSAPAPAAFVEADAPEAEAEAKQAAETTDFKASAPESVAGPGPGTASDAPAAEPKAVAAAAALSGLKPDDDESSSRAAGTVIPRKGEDTVVPRKGATGYRPTEVSIPVARSAPSASAPAQSKPPEPAKPTFTAAKPTDRGAPPFTASPARPATPGRPTPPRADTPVPPPPVPPASPPSSQRSAYGQGGAAAGFPVPGKGSTTPFPPPSVTYRQQGGKGALYPGPSQASPDVSRQYLPGAGGGHAKGGRGLSRRVIWAAVAVVAAAVIGVGTALALHQSGGNGSTSNAGHTGTGTQPTAVPSVADTKTGFESVDALNNPSTALPGTGWTTQTVTKAEATSAAAGFSIDIPPGWTETSNGLATDFNGPRGQLVEVDLTQQSTSDMLTAATQVRNASVPKFPGYKQSGLQAVPVRHAEGALWKFSWTPAGSVQETADDIFFAQGSSGGVQDYAIYIRSASSDFGTNLSIFDKILQTFQVVS